MGDTNRVNCTQCGTSYDRHFLLGKQGALNVCPMCGAFISLSSDEEESFSHDDEPSFGEDVVLGENDSFDEDKIDRWWYSITEPGELGKEEKGLLGTTCTKCGYLSSAPYYIAKSGDYLLVDARYIGKCIGCGNELKNHVLSKRPSDWVDPRQRDMWVRDYENSPKCPTCNSINIKKIPVSTKVASVAMWGVLSRKVHKQWHCNICGSEW